VTPNAKKPSKPRKQPKPTRLSKKAKLQIIIEILTKQPGIHLKRGFQVQLREQFNALYNTRLSIGYTSELVKEALESLERAKTYLHSKRWYMLQHQRLYEEEVKAQDKRGQKETLRDMEKLDGHLVDKHSMEIVDTPEGKALEDFFDKKTGKKKAAS